MISTKKSENDGSDFMNKSLQPGNTVVKITSIYLEKFPFGENAYNLILNAEGVELDNFEGFFIDRDDESKGRYKSQVARIKSSQWAYADKELDNDVKILRDEEMVKFLRAFCFATECSEWLDKKDDAYETIEELIEAFNNECPFKDKWLTVCIAGREYQNKSGYNAYDLFFPKFTRNGIPFESIEIEHDDSRVYIYDQKEHIKRKVIKEVESFEEKKEDFELDA